MFPWRKLPSGRMRPRDSSSESCLDPARPSASVSRLVVSDFVVVREAHRVRRAGSSFSESSTLPAGLIPRTSSLLLAIL